MPGYSFDEQSVRRIVKSVLASERNVRNRPQHWERFHTRRHTGVNTGGGTGTASYNVRTLAVKTSTTNPVSVELLGFGLTPTGSNVVVYDPHQKFSAGGTGTGAYGVAQLVLDPNSGDTRLEFEDLESLALLVCGVTTEGIAANGTGLATVSSSHFAEWNVIDPGAQVVLESCRTLGSSQSFVGRLVDPDTYPPKYMMIDAPEAAQGGDIVLGVMTESAGASYSWTGTSTAGTTVDENNSGQCPKVRGAQGKAIVLIQGANSACLPEYGTGTDSEGNYLYEYYEVAVSSAYDLIGLSAGKVVMLFAPYTIEGAGTAEPSTLYWGKYLDTEDYLTQLQGYEDYDAAQENELHLSNLDILSWNEAGSGGTGGGDTIDPGTGTSTTFTCITITYVTSVDCVDGEVVYTTETKEIVVCQ